MTYRSDLDALAARRRALADEVSQKQQELAEATRLHEDAARRASLPVLDNLRIATPCTKRWADMTGDERSRHCTDCNKSVYNISGLTRDEAQALLIEKEGKLCVRYFQRSDGTILLKDCTIGVSKRRKRRLFAAGAVAMLAGSAAGMAMKFFSSDDPERPRELLGEPPVADDDYHEVAGGLEPMPEPEVVVPPEAPRPAPPLNLSWDSPARR